MIGFVISCIIEVCQLVLCRGLFEWDDMVHNALGCLVGFEAVKRCARRRR